MSRQKLIHLHTSGDSTTKTFLLQGDTALALGEIAVQHNAEDTKLYVRLSDSATGAETGTLGEFITKTAIDAAIKTASDALGLRIDGVVEAVSALTDNLDEEIERATSAETTLSTAIQAERTRAISAETDLDTAIKDEVARATSAETDIKKDVSDLQNSVSTIEDQLEGFNTTEGAVKDYVDAAVSAVSEVAQTALQGISAGTSHDYVTVSVSEKDANNNQGIEVELTVVDLSAATVNNKGVAEAYDVKQKFNAVDGEVSALTDDVAVIKAQLTGFDETTGAVKTYVDEVVASAVTSVYKVKGSVLTYSALPDTGLTEGDVYNVEEACVVSGKPYPAGTNWVWVADESEAGGHWDPLGGTIDLSPYLLKSEYTTYTAATDSRLERIEDNVSDLIDGLSAETVARETADTELDERLDLVEGDLTTGTTAQAIAQLRNDLNDETAARTSADTKHTQDISKLETDLSNEVTRATSAETDLDTAIKDEAARAISAETDLELDLNAEIARAQSAETKLTTDLASEVARATSADSRHDTAISSLEGDVADLEGIVGPGFGEGSGNTLTDKIIALQSSVGGAVQGVEVHNTASNHITASEDASTHIVTLNFDEMVIDCGTYGE